MDSLGYTFEERGLPFTDDIGLSMDGLVRSRNPSNGWDAETLSVPVKDMFEGLEFVETGLPEITKNSVISTQCLDYSLDDANCDSGKSVPCTPAIRKNSSIEFGTRFSSSAVKTDDEKLAPTGLKIEKLAASREMKGSLSSVDDSVLSAEGSSVSAKRARIANMQPQIPVCIVHGCNKDLSSSKEYHKKHKVCDIHSKTAVVIVNGIRQRFCQQCSRFHVLAEFDDDKRSCRKRLAGHNERRRKPHLETYFDSTFSGKDLSTSLLFSENLPGGFFGQLYNEPTNNSRLLTMPLKFGCSLPTSPFNLNEMGKQYPSKNCPNSPLSVLDLSTGLNSSAALSLLSARSQSSLSNSAGIPIDYPLIFEEYHHSNLAYNQNSSKTQGIFSSSSGEADQRVLDASVSVGFGTPKNELSQESPSVLNDLKHCPSPEGANTVDLLQLSLHLQRVEHEKQCDQVELENGIFCHPNIT